MSDRSMVFWVSDVEEAAEALARAAGKYAPDHRRAFVEAAARGALDLGNTERSDRPIGADSDSRDVEAEGGRG